MQNVQPRAQEFLLRKSTDGTVSTNIATGVIDVSHDKTIGIQGVVSSASTLTCTATVEVSNFSPDLDKFDTYPVASISLTADGTFSWNIADCGFKWIRVRLNVSAGSAVFDILGVKKSI
jgi:hypothetical protein